MKSLLRYCSALLCFALLLGVSSVPVKATHEVLNAVETAPFETFEELNIPRSNLSTTALERLGEYTVRQYGFLQLDNGNHFGAYTFDFYPCNDTVEQKSVDTYANKNGYLANGVFTYHFSIARNDGLPIMLAGEKTSLRFDNIYLSLYDNTLNKYFRDANVKIQFLYTDGGSSSLIPVDYSHSGAVGSFTFKDYTAEKDVKTVKLNVTFNDFNDYAYGNWDTNTLTAYYGEWADGVNFVVSTNAVDESTGLLSSLIEWVKSIKQGVTDIFSQMYDGFSYVINQLIELPALIWQKFEDGIKFLFLPTEEYIVNYKQSMDTLLADKFGAVYEVVNLTFESWDRITANDEQNIISVEEVSIPLPDNNSFSFGGYDVPIVPNGFEWLATIVKSLVGVVCTVSFVNGLRKRYDEIMER